MEGEGTSTILLFVAALALVLIAVVLWQLLKKRGEDYTLTYKKG